MIDIVYRLIAWVDHRFRSVGWALKFVYVATLLSLIAIVALVVQAIPGFDKFKELFSQARPEVQTAILVVLMLVAVAMGVLGMQRNNQAAESKAKLAIAEADRDRLQIRWDRLQAVSSHVELWKRDCLVAVPPFVPPNQRKTRFVSVLNLKGGVGKTTLTANLAACLSLATTPKRILLVDVDFQGTLSDATVDKILIQAKRPHDAFVYQLLLEPNFKPGLIDQLAVPMNRVPSTKVLLAREQTDNHDFRFQAKFFVDATSEPRFQFRKHLHQQEIFDSYDYVIFDCPPRITTSVVNALFCSDYVFVPTRLDRGSIDSVPRTINVLKTFGPHCPAELLGVVANQVALNNRSKLTKSDQGNLEYLRALLENLGLEERLFASFVPSSSRAVGIEHGTVSSINPANRGLFHPVVLEFVRRIK